MTLHGRTQLLSVSYTDTEDGTKLKVCRASLPPDSLPSLTQMDVLLTLSTDSGEFTFTTTPPVYQFCLSLFSMGHHLRSVIANGNTNHSVSISLLANQNYSTYLGSFVYANFAAYT